MIYINGAIGSGKSSLTKFLTKELGTKGFYEDVSGNAMLKKFYSAGEESRLSLAFPLQISFLDYRYQQLREGLYLAETKGIENVVYDSSLLSDSLMAGNLRRRNEFPKEEYDLYLHLLEHMQSNVSGHPFTGFPDVVVWLKLSFETMIEHIQMRNREFETTDESLVEYYHSVWETYESWGKSYSQSPMVVVDMDKYDFVNNVDDREYVLDLIEQKLVDLGKLSESDFNLIKEKRIK